MKIPTQEFPFHHEAPRERTIQKATTDEKSDTVRVEVGRSSSPSYKLRNLPASDVVKIRVYRRGKGATLCQRNNIATEEIRFRRGDIVVQDAGIEALSAANSEPNRNWSHTQNQEWGYEREPQW